MKLSRRRNATYKGRPQWKGLLFMLPSLLGVGIFVFLPFLDVIRRSFCEAVTGRFSGLENYRMVFENTAFRLAAQNTLRFVGICIPLLLALSLGAALLLYGQIKYRQALKSAFLLPRNSGGIGSSSLEGGVSFPGTFERTVSQPKSYASGLDEFFQCFLGAGLQLYLEKFRVRCNFMVGWAGVYSV